MLKTLRKSPTGPKANDDDWLKSKIEEAKDPVPEDSSDEESDSSDEDSDGEETEDLSDEDDGEGTGLDTVGCFKFKFEGVSYTRTFDYPEKVWKVEDDDGNEVGEWVGDVDSDSGWINWEDKCWEDIHKDHDDYDEDA